MVWRLTKKGCLVLLTGVLAPALLLNIYNAYIIYVAYAITGIAMISMIMIMTNYQRGLVRAV